MEEDGAVLRWLKANPYVTFLWAVFLILTPLASVWALQDAWGLGAALLAGLIGGAGGAIIVTVNRILGTL